MAQEVELKLRVEGQDDISDALMRYFAVESFTEELLSNIYYDTCHLDLHQHKVALRIRTKKGRYIQTLKTRGQTLDGVSVRGEWEWDLGRVEIAQDVLASCEGWPQQLDTGALEPIFETNFTRKRAQLECHNSVIELAYDCGVVLSCGSSEPIHELELELLQGQASILHKLRDKLKSEFNASPQDVSKAETGYALYLDKHSNIKE